MHTGIEYHEVSDWITATNTTIVDTADVTYDARNYIELNTGFVTEPGAVFLAFIDGCDTIPPPCDTIGSINISTGINAQGDTLDCIVGEVDPFWKLINNPPIEQPCTNPLANNNINGNAYTVNFPFYNWVNLPNSTAIAPVNGSCHTEFECNNLINTNNEYIPYIFERSFCVSEDDSVNINLDASADDEMYLELWDISNNTIINTMPGNNNFMTAPHNWNINVPLTVGTYALRANLVNTHHVTLGFSVAGNITSLSGRQTIVQDTCCVNNTINVRKILDYDCDGEVSMGDAVGNGWTFELHNSANNIVQTATTNINGELFFNNVLTGNYMIVEIPQPGWVFGTPVSGQKPVTVSPGSSNVVEFYNCPDVPPSGTCCADPCTFFDRVNAPVLTNAPDLGDCTIYLTTVALDSCDQVSIDWGDGNVDGPFPPGNVALSHTYATPGTYEVVMFVEEIGADGNACWEGVSRFEVDATCPIPKQKPQQIVVFQSYPNPFTEQTTITFTLTKDAPVTLLVYDSMGREIAALLDTELMTTGTHEMTFDGTDYPSGVYYYTIQAGDFFGTQKMILTR